MMLPRRVHAADAPDRLAARIDRRHATPFVLFRQQIDVRGKFFVELLIQLPLAKYGHEPGERLDNFAHHPSPPSSDVASTRPITDARRSQFAASAASSFCPAGVNE